MSTKDNKTGIKNTKNSPENVKNCAKNTKNCAKKPKNCAENEENSNKLKVSITTLGCDKNTCDSEQIAANLKEQGFILVPADDEADIIIVNTCAFIESARAEAVEVIKQKLAYKPRAKIVVTGCMTVLHKDLIPEGVDEIWDLQDFQKPQKVRKLLSTPQSYVYIKIADGCDNWCSYCTIPAIRGRYKSRSAEDILAEVKHFAALGVPEFILVAQDLTKYSVSYNGKTLNLTGLIKEISKVKNVQRIRLHYVYTNGITDELVEEIANNPKVAKYLDIPLQHVNARILGLMNRKGSAEEYLNLVNKLRNRIPDITIRSTFMVGFPTESDAEFKELCDFIIKTRLDCVGFFAYSREAGTRAYAMPQVSAETKNFRLSTVQSLQTGILNQKNNEMSGKTIKVVCDFCDDVIGYSIARTQGQSPDVDPCVFVKERLIVGKFYDVLVTGTADFDLKGELL